MQVNHYVRRQFRARDRWAPTTYESSASLDNVSHYVEGRTLLLMEPVIAMRPNFVAEVHHVGRNFQAYRWALQQLRTNGKLIAFTGFDDKELSYQVSDLYVANADGSGTRNLTAAAGELRVSQSAVSR